MRGDGIVSLRAVRATWLRLGALCQTYNVQGLRHLVLNRKRRGDHAVLQELAMVDAEVQIAGVLAGERKLTAFAP